MGTESSRLKEQMYSWILSEMREAEKAGLSFSVDGKFYTSGEAQELHRVMEDSYYMKSYVEDDSGKIVQVDFDHIENV